MRYTEIDRRVEALAAKQHGAFSRKQAFDVGASDRFVNRRLTARYWCRPLPGVYVLAASAGIWLRQAKVAELSVEGASLAGRAAAALLGLTGFRPGPIELIAPANVNCVHPFATVHRYSGARITTVEAIRTTTVAQTLYDLAAAGVGTWRLERAMDDALLARGLAVPDLQERLSFYAGSRRAGLPRIRALVLERLEEGWTPPESELERLLLDVLSRLPSRPRVERQADLPWRPSQPGRVDVLLADHRLVIEADGRRWHFRAADFDRDRWRDNEAVAHDLRVMRFTWVHLRDLAADVTDIIERTIRNVGSPHPPTKGCLHDRSVM